MSIELDVGTPPNGFKDWTTALVRFHGFADLTTQQEVNMFNHLNFHALVINGG